jgi:hypothetical protein
MPVWTQWRGAARCRGDLEGVLAEFEARPVAHPTGQPTDKRWFKTCFWDEDVTAREENLKRILTTTLWVLAMILPGGLPMLALWVAYKAARQRRQNQVARKSTVTWTAPKQLDADAVTVTGAGACSVTMS